eukprot:TRINITY_DN2218_c0_g1_i3.p2 TRINITY_DN2218_c0_g1~~TRINITY_DN2218_c0_g1_i3.p2  ORF type:complete len:158 (-),score=78.00 TRINITY_DN2218_c0_g1_i3:418-891(-)
MAEEVPAGEDIFYVCKKALEGIEEKLKKGEEITQDAVTELTFPENLKDDEIMVPVDMRGVGEEFDDVEQMVEKLGPKGTAEAFVKAKKYFDENKNGEPADERPKAMTAAEWKAVLEDDIGEGEEEELMLEGEEEEAELDDEEDAGAEEPAAKKAKTA